jgi:phosphatidate cytidylyltransferase
LSNLGLRILVAAIGIPIILLLTLAGGFYFFALMVLVSSFALHEFYGLGRTKGFKPQVAVGLVFGFCVNAVFEFDKVRYWIVGLLIENHISLPFPSMAQLFLIEFLLFVPLILLCELFRNNGSALGNIAITVMGVGYVSLGIGSLVGLRELFVPNDFPFYTYFNLVGADIPSQLVNQVYSWGAYSVITVFASIWVCDSAAYFAGTYLGKHKLFERVSPKKTWEGAIAGFLGALGVFLLAGSLVLPYMSVMNALICGVIVGLFGQLGDMVESLLKRDAGVKDSSTLIPGHGGVLDRFDSLIMVSPFIFFYLDFVVF